MKQKYYIVPVKLHAFNENSTDQTLLSVEKVFVQWYEYCSAPVRMLAVAAGTRQKTKLAVATQRLQPCWGPGWQLPQSTPKICITSIRKYNQV